MAQNSKVPQQFQFDHGNLNFPRQFQFDSGQFQFQFDHGKVNFNLIHGSSWLATQSAGTSNNPNVPCAATVVSCRGQIEVDVVKLKLPWWNWNSRQSNWNLPWPNCRGQFKLPWWHWNYRDQIEIAVALLGHRTIPTENHRKYFYYHGKCFAKGKTFMHLLGLGENVIAGTKRAIPSRQYRSILAARVANHSARFGPSCLLAELAI